MSHKAKQRIEIRTSIGCPILSENHFNERVELISVTSSGNVLIAKKLLNDSVSSEISRIKESKSFQIAATQPHVQQFPYLGEKQIDLKAKDFKENVETHIAVKFANSVTASYLLENKALMNVKNIDGETPLHIAAGKSSSVPLYLLLKGNANINAQDNEGNTPLHTAVWSRRTNNITLLLENGACAEVKDGYGATAYQLFKEIIEGESDKCNYSFDELFDFEDDDDDISFDVEDLFRVHSGDDDYYDNDDDADLYEYKEISCAGDSNDGVDVDYELKPKKKTEIIFGKYILKLKLLQPLDETVEGINLNEEEAAFCNAEVEKIKSTQVVEDFSLYEVVAQSETPRYLLDYEKVVALKTLFQSPDYLDRFPNYGGLLKSKFMKSKHSRYNHTLQAIESVFSRKRHTCIQVTEDIWLNIFSYLSEDELVNFTISGTTDRAFICKRGTIVFGTSFSD